MYRLSEFSHGEKCLSSISRSSEIIISFFRFLPHYVLVYVSCQCCLSASAKVIFNERVVNRYMYYTKCSQFKMGLYLRLVAAL